MKAMILAAGRGERMRPLTDHTPKPLLSVGGNPLIIWHIEKLKQAGFREIIINIAWLGEQIPAALGDGSRFGVSLRYSDEQQQGALETAGGIIKALPLLCGPQGDEPFLVINGDIWCDCHYLAQSPLKNNDLAHLILVNNPPHNPAGDFLLSNGRVDADNAVNADEAVNTDGANKTEQHEKYTFSGVGYYHPDLFSTLPQGKRPLAPVLRKAMRKNNVSGELFTGDWRDIGTPDRLHQLDEDLSG